MCMCECVCYTTFQRWEGEHVCITLRQAWRHANSKHLWPVTSWLFSIPAPGFPVENSGSQNVHGCNIYPSLSLCYNLTIPSVATSKMVANKKIITRNHKDRFLGKAELCYLIIGNYFKNFLFISNSILPTLRTLKKNVDVPCRFACTQLIQVIIENDVCTFVTFYAVFLNPPMWSICIKLSHKNI